MTSFNYLPESEFTRLRNEWPSGGTLLDRISYYSSAPTETGCIEWTGPQTGSGRPTINIGKRNVLVSRLVWIRHKGRIPQGKIIRHLKCHNKRCINIDHLAVGTHFDNAKDRDNDGNTARGTSHYKAQLTEEQVLEIIKWKESHRDAAIKYGVSKSAVVHIRRGTSWAHIPRPKIRD